LRSKPPARRRRDAGFTLLETLVAVAVLAMVLGGVMGTLGWSMRTQTLRLERAWLAELNRSVLEAYLRQPDPAARTGSAPGDWRWRISDAPVTQDNGTTGLREVTVDGWSERRPDLVVSLSTLR
jgi:prepilin-type N-terminal cleavage/methylation domain-containing protein